MSGSNAFRMFFGFGNSAVFSALLPHANNRFGSLLCNAIKGASGAEIDLPQLNNIRKLAAANAFDVLVVREIDRLRGDIGVQNWV